MSSPPYKNPVCSPDTLTTWKCNIHANVKNGSFKGQRLFYRQPLLLFCSMLQFLIFELIFRLTPYHPLRHTIAGLKRPSHKYVACSIGAVFSQRYVHVRLYLQILVLHIRIHGSDIVWSFLHCLETHKFLCTMLAML